MLVHATFPLSTVNGPGNRAVVWLQGCTLGCEGCWNPQSHAFLQQRCWPVEKVAEWILSCKEIEGVTFSGGEPMQQADELLELCRRIKSRRPEFSLGIFSGYTLPELETGRWKFRNKSGEWKPGNPQLFARIHAFLDFGIFGRFNRNMAGTDKPLCGSRNQNVFFFSDRYFESDLEPQGYEINFAEDGQMVTITGFPSHRL